MATRRHAVSHRNAPAVQLGMTMEMQDQRFWCWAAVGVCLQKFRGVTLTQCEQAGRHLKRSCCDAPASCNEEAYMRDLLVELGLLVQDGRAPLSFEDIRRTIAREQPIVCTIEWTDRTTHYVLLDGYVEAARLLSVRDPWETSYVMPYDVFTTSYLGRGRWTEYFITKPR